MDSLTSFKNISDKVKERAAIINEYNCTAKGYETACSMLEAEIKTINLQIEHLDQDILHTEEQIEMMRPWIQIGQNSLETMLRCVPLLAQHNTCVATEIVKIKQLEASMLEEHSAMYEAEKERLKQAFPSYNQKLIELRSLKIETLDLTKKLKVKRRIRAQQWMIREKIFYTKIIRFAKICSLSNQLSKVNEEIRRKRDEEKAQIKEVVAKGENETARDMREQVDLFQNKFVMSQLKFDTNEPLSEVSVEEFEAQSTSAISEKSGVKELFGFPVLQNHFNPNVREDHVAEKSDVRTLENAAKVKILDNHLVVQPNIHSLPQKRRSARDRLQEFHQFIKRRASRSQPVSRQNSENVLSQQSIGSNNSQLTCSQKFADMRGASQRKHNFQTIPNVTATAFEKPSVRSNNDQFQCGQEFTGTGGASQQKQNFQILTSITAPNLGKAFRNEQTVAVTKDINKEHIENQKKNIQNQKPLLQASTAVDEVLKVTDIRHNAISSNNVLNMETTNIGLNIRPADTTETSNNQNRVMESESVIVDTNQAPFKTPQQSCEEKPARNNFQFQSGFGLSSAFYNPSQPNNAVQPNNTPMETTNMGLNIRPSEFNIRPADTTETSNNENRVMETEPIMVDTNQSQFKAPQQSCEEKPARNNFHFQSGFGLTSAFFNASAPNNAAQPSSTPFQLGNQSMFQMTFDGGDMDTSRYSLDDYDGVYTSPRYESDADMLNNGPFISAQTAAPPNGGFLFSFGSKQN